MLYKQRPYIYAALGLLGLVLSKGSKVGLLSSLTLVICAVVIFFMRSAHQEKTKDLGALHNQLSKEQNLKNRDSKHNI